MKVYKVPWRKDVLSSSLMFKMKFNSHTNLTKYKVSEIIKDFHKFENIDKKNLFSV